MLPGTSLSRISLAIAVVVAAATGGWLILTPHPGEPAPGGGSPTSSGQSEETARQELDAMEAHLDLLGAVREYEDALDADLGRPAGASETAEAVSSQTVDTAFRRRAAVRRLAEFGTPGLKVVVNSLRAALESQDGSRAARMLSTVLDLEPSSASWVAEEILRTTDVGNVPEQARFQLVHVASKSDAEPSRRAFVSLASDRSRTIRECAVQMLCVRAACGAKWARDLLERRRETEPDAEIRDAIDLFLANGELPGHVGTVIRRE